MKLILVLSLVMMGCSKEPTSRRTAPELTGMTWGWTEVIDHCDEIEVVGNGDVQQWSSKNPSETRIHITNPEYFSCTWKDKH